ncbi:MAG: hypothetical protein AAF468_05445 [Pseudomonadota bacterium]
MGHFARCQNLADEFAQHNHTVTLMIGPSSTLPVGTEANHQVSVLDGRSDPAEEHNSYPDNLDAIVFDLNHRQMMKEPRRLAQIVDAGCNHCDTVALIDSVGEDRFRAFGMREPAIIISPYLEADAVRPSSQSTQLMGAQYAVLNQNLRSLRCKRMDNSNDGDKLKLVVSFGGSDPWKLTDRCLPVLLGQEFRHFEIAIVAGPLFGTQYRSMIEKKISEANRPVCFVDGAKGVMELFSECDVAVIAPGLTRYELAYLGVPSVLVCPDRYFYDATQSFEQDGIASRVLADGSNFEAALEFQLQRLCSDPELRQKFSQTGLKIVDGHGARRICDAVFNQYSANLADAQSTVASNG